MRSSNLAQITASSSGPNGRSNQIFQPPSRMAMTPKPTKRIFSTLVQMKQSSFDDLDLDKENQVQPSDADIVEDYIDDDDVVVHTESDAFLFSKTGNSMISLTSWDSNSTLDNALHGLDTIAHRKHGGLFNSKCRATNSTIWETASHLGISTTTNHGMDDYYSSSNQRQRNSALRSPSITSQYELDSNRLKNKQKKQKKPKLRAVSQLFQRSSMLVKSRDSRNKLSTGGSMQSEVSIGPSCPTNENVCSSRRDSLLRGLFFRQH